MMQSIQIHWFPRHMYCDKTKMEQITNVVNDVYRESEKSLWKNEVVRTTVTEITELTENGEIAVAQLGEEIIGSVRIRRMDEHTGEFGMLAVNKRYQGKGIGRQLIDFAERECEKEQLQKMQLELLVPQNGTHPDKVILEKWYTRLGYQPVRTEAIETSFPELSERLATPCQFIIFQKELQPHVLKK